MYSQGGPKSVSKFLELNEVKSVYWFGKMQENNLKIYKFLKSFYGNSLLKYVVNNSDFKTKETTLYFQNVRILYYKLYNI